MNDVLTNLIIKSIRQLTEAVDRLENSISNTQELEDRVSSLEKKFSEKERLH